MKRLHYYSTLCVISVKQVPSQVRTQKFVQEKAAFEEKRKEGLHSFPACPTTLKGEDSYQNTISRLFSQVDKELETGEYFLKEAERKAKKNAEKKEKQAAAEGSRQDKREKSFQAPNENKKKTVKTESNDVDIKSLKAKVKKAQEKKTKKKKV